MHITKERLKKLIKEEFGRMSEIETGEGEMGSPRPAGAAHPDIPHTAVQGAKSAAGPGGQVDVAATLKKVKQTLIAGGQTEDAYVVKLLGAVATLVADINIATNAQALRALKILEDQAAQLG
jgi:hypothetical protein